MPKPLIVQPALIGITQHGIRLMHGLKECGRLGAGVPIGMALHHPLTERLANALRAGIAIDTQHLVMVVTQQDAHAVACSFGTVARVEVMRS